MNRKFQVFVSSTFVDLRDERQAAVEAILGANHIPAGMELFTAGNDSQLRVIERWIQSSDILLLISGGRYGSIEPKSGYSYTEYEYRFAIDQEIPVIGIILESEYSDEQDKHAKYLAFRKLIESRICAYAGDSSKLQLEIYRALNDQVQNQDLVGYIRSDQNWTDPSKDAQIKILEEQNSLYKQALERLTLQVPQDRAVETALDLVRKFGFKVQTFDRATKKYKIGEFFTLDRWLLSIETKLHQYPHEINMGAGQLFTSIAPALTSYGLMQRVEKDNPPLFGKGNPTRWTSYVLTDLGSRVLSELKRAQAQARLSL